MHVHRCVYMCIYVYIDMCVCVCVCVSVCAYLVAGLVETAGAAKEEGARAVNELDATVTYGHGYV